MNHTGDEDLTMLSAFFHVFSCRFDIKRAVYDVYLACLSYRAWPKHLQLSTGAQQRFMSMTFFSEDLNRSGKSKFSSQNISSNFRNTRKLNPFTFGEENIA